MNSLQQIELMEVEEIEFSESTGSNYEIKDLDGLNWAFRKLHVLQLKEKEIKQLASVERDRIDTWEKGELSTIENSASFFKAHIQKYHQQLFEEDPKKNKMLSTPYGKSKTRKSKETPDKADEEVILQYVIENEMDEFIKNSVKWGDLKKSLKIVEISGEKVVVDENGQIVPGVIVKPESISYSVEV